MKKKSLYGNEAREKILAGAKKIAAAVKVTLGPKGRNVLIGESAVVDYGVHSLPTHVTKDGYTVTKAFEIDDDPFEQIGALMIKEAAFKTVEMAGDGTTTCVVLAEAILERGIELINAGHNPMDLKKGIYNAVEHVVEKLKEMAIPIKGDIEKIRQIATVSANNDKEIGDLIASAFEKIGMEGVIDIESSNSVETRVKVSDGYKWENGWLSPLFVNNKEKQICEFSDPYILMYERKVTHFSQVVKALELCNQQGRPIVIICEGADEQGLAFLAMNNMQQKIRCCVVTAPSFGENRREEMEDIALLTGGTYISDSKGVGIKDIEIENFGQAKKVVISKTETIIIGSNSNANAVDDLLNELRMNLTEAKSENEKALIEKRIARVKGGIAVIQVGANTETEMKEKMDRIDDAVRATKAAIAEGYVAGGGSCFVKIFKENGVFIDIDSIKESSEYSEISIDEIMSLYKNTGKTIVGMTEVENIKYTIWFNFVLYEPLKQICKNAGIESESIIKTIQMKGENFGYNAKTDTIENLLESGIIDPIKVLRCALQNAASSASMILTSECLIVDTL